MNSALVAAFTIVWLAVGYLVYGRFIRRKLVSPDDSIPTPANSKFDNVDFKPANPMVLFGHHFSSIAGAGPIIGPIVAVAFFGWGVSLIWILVAVVFMGAVHDYLALMVSVRNDGRSIPDVAKDVVGNRSSVLFEAFVVVTLILVVAAFIDVAALSYVAKPEIVMASLGLIPLAMAFGVAIHKVKVNLVVATVSALGGLIGLIYLGYLFPIALHDIDKTMFPDAVAVLSLGLSVPVAMNVWYLVLALYGLAASVLPVWFLLQPRDYIANWILIFGMLLGFVGLFVSHPPINAEFFTHAVTANGPVWPMLFIVIACGAISGFHSIVASGTTAKQLAREGHGLMIGYGSMLTEGALAVLALLAVGAGLAWTDLDKLVVQPGGAGAIVAFGKGYGMFTDPLIGVTAGVFFGVTMINAFVMTTLDTSVRLTRFIVVEMFGEKAKILSNRWVASLACVVPAYVLLISGAKSQLWPMFASANQLVAVLTLIVVSAYLVGRGRPVWYTLIPAIILLVTTEAALVYQSWQFLVGYDPTKGPNVVLAVVAMVLIVLAAIVAWDGWAVVSRKWKKA